MSAESEKTCGSCRHWGRPENDSGVFRSCTAVIHDKKSVTEQDDEFESWPWLDEEEKAEIRAVRRHLAVVRDGSGYAAALKCRADFGCRLWREKS